MNTFLMNLVPILKEGFSMMLVGMGTVLVFLCIMICAMFIMSFAVKKLNEIFPEPVVAVPGAKKQAKSSDDSEIAAAIVAALFRK
jgi:oxaloacetate decarboxylase gamma subunit